MYKTHFKSKRDAHFFSDPDNRERKEIIESIQRDLSRFLPPQEMSLFRDNDFKGIFDALKVVFAPLGES
jgi:hypothetical protein